MNIKYHTTSWIESLKEVLIVDDTVGIATMFMLWNFWENACISMSDDYYFVDAQSAMKGIVMFQVLALHLERFHLQQGGRIDLSHGENAHTADFFDFLRRAAIFQGLVVQSDDLTSSIEIRSRSQL